MRRLEQTQHISQALEQEVRELRALAKDHDVLGRTLEEDRA
ncbi:hypothetical protein [Streptomyces turgidiscabies]|uniref:Uncharacterized protein n=1 Tax=Streptomyces turgidiscabies TaxID=85558 RepID=A0ABU0RI89_9ACTN|nr:hypothetical protein [Streptomyces turgidiscabies]MDQ0931704.1 hypothetical protein [Streptomyces turgidiscabies]